MKIADIKVGTEYGVVDKPGEKWSYKLPRQVEALAIETVAKEIWLGGGFTSVRGTKNVRMVRVRFLDPAQETYVSTRYEIASAEEGSEKLIEARLLVGPWSSLRADVHARVSAKQAEARTKQEYEDRIRALLPKKWRDTWFHCSVSHTGNKARPVHTELHISDDPLDHILALAEKGAQAE